MENRYSPSLISAMLIGILLSAGLMTGCGDHQYIDEQINKSMHTEIMDLREELEDAREGIRVNRDAIEALKQDAAKIDERLVLVEDALGRAEAGKKLTRGRLMYEVTISDESVPFGYNRTSLSEDARAEMDIFAEVLIEENRDVYIEIQGHTDDIGPEQYNLRLGQERAEAVRAYLHTVHGFPLHRMNAFSYGESEPAVPNTGPENRARNRRVVLMVLQ